MLPPVRYPDGHHYVKIGSGHWRHPLDDLDQIGEWFRSAPAGEDVARLSERLRELVPELADADIVHDPCVLADTASDRPIIDWSEPGRVAVAAGCNGRSAKSADEIGRLAAHLVNDTDPGSGDLALCSL